MLRMRGGAWPTELPPSDWGRCHLEGSSDSTVLGLPQTLALQARVPLAVLKPLPIGTRPIIASGKRTLLTLPVEPMAFERAGSRLGQRAEVFCL